MLRMHCGVLNMIKIERDKKILLLLCGLLTIVYVYENSGLILNKDVSKLLTPCFQRPMEMIGPTGDTFQYCKERELKSMNECLSCERHNFSCKLCKMKTERKCFNIAMKRCENSKHKVIKVLRLDTSLIQTLLEQHSRLKLIQIFRDPRAIVNSRNETNWYFNETDPIWFHNETNYDSHIRVLCKRMKKDLRSAEKLKLKYPERVKILQYEDFHDPHRLASKLYQFTGMVPRPGMHAFLKNLTYKKEAFHPDNYRTMLEWDLVDKISNQCYQVIKQLGLRVFKSEKELKNKSLNIVEDKLPYSIDEN